MPLIMESVTSAFRSGAGQLGDPITMARMNRLFGVTMAEQGVSQLVSVDLEMAEQIREAG